MLLHSRSARLFAFAIAAIAGYVDAVGFLGSGAFFVSFMSGNTTRLAVGLAGDGSAAAIAAGLIASFVAGVTATSLLRRRMPADSKLEHTLAFCAALLTMATIAIGLSSGIAPFMLLAFAMGGINLALENEGEVRFGLTYMTGTLIKLGTRLADALAGQPRSDWLPLMLLWLALSSGAILGGFGYGSLGMSALWPAVVCVWSMAGLALLGRKV